MFANPVGATWTNGCNVGTIRTTRLLAASDVVKDSVSVLFSPGNIASVTEWGVQVIAGAASARVGPRVVVATASRADVVACLMTSSVEVECAAALSARPLGHCQYTKPPTMVTT